jgi:hypothetical protein
MTNKKKIDLMTVEGEIVALARDGFSTGIQRERLASILSSFQNSMVKRCVEICGNHMDATKAKMEIKQLLEIDNED